MGLGIFAGSNSEQRNWIKNFVRCRSQRILAFLNQFFCSLLVIANKPDLGSDKRHLFCELKFSEAYVGYFIDNKLILFKFFNA